MPRVVHGVRLVAAALSVLAGIGGTPSAQPGSNGHEGAEGVSLVFPTDNDAILDVEPARFYIGLERHFGREREWTWEGGTYGYVREARETPLGWRFTRFHEGIDIAPRYRDDRGEPLDDVRAVDDGRVVYVSARPGASDYGRYVVVEHVWEGSPFYSLYAHLASVTVYEGDRVRRGEPLGVLGYSGQGLDRERAHVHFEINLLLNEHFTTWRTARNARLTPIHGRFHGSNLAGVSPVEILERSYGARNFSVVDLLAHQEADLTVYVPAGPPPDLLDRYPWMCRSCGGAPPDWAPSWEVGLTLGGVPVRVEPSERRVTALRLGDVDGFVEATYQASRLLTRPGPGADLSAAGRALVSLLFTRPDYVPDW